MATRKAKMSFTIKRFVGFWNQFRKSKRGVAGVAIIAFFVILAVFAPLIAPYAPMDPKWDADKYPAQTTPPKIAEKLCSPAWYKYLPWVKRGSTQTQEVFWANITKLGGVFFTVFGRLEVTGTEDYIPRDTFDEHREIATDDLIRLSKAAIERPQLEILFPNGTLKEVTMPEEWWDLRSPAVVGGEFGGPAYDSMRSFITGLYETLGEDLVYTAFRVKYTYSSDVTENVELVPEFQFSSAQTFNEKWKWNVTGSSTVEYNSVEGVDHDGCVEITYNPLTGENESTVVLYKQFKYPYWEPPLSFWGHLSTSVQGGVPGMPVTLTIFTQKEGREPIDIINLYRGASISYDHRTIYPGEQDVLEASGSLSPEKVMWPTPGNYTLAIKVVFSGNQGTTVNLDDFNIILYGNIFGLLGTDNAANSAYPRDIFSTLVYGTRVSLIVGILSALFGTVIGLFLGLIAGYVGGITDEAIMRVGDLFLVLPTLPLFIILVVALKLVYGVVSMWNIIIVLTLFGWMGFARSVRSMVLSLRERPFVEAAKAAGAGKLYIINRHLLPNVFALVYITLATAVPGAIITEASLSWLGLGDPMIPSWGKVLYDFESSGIAITRGLTEYWFWIFPSCIAIALLATAFILMGYALDEILNPRLRMRR